MQGAGLAGERQGLLAVAQCLRIFAEHARVPPDAVECAPLSDPILLRSEQLEPALRVLHRLGEQLLLAIGQG